jgi:DNA-binding CsgD family transcriptional regulator
MPSRIPEGVIVSPLRLARDLLSILLAQRCGIRVAGQFSRLEECVMPASLGVLVWDHEGREAEEGRALARLRTSFPGLRIISINSHTASTDEVVSLVRDLVDYPGPLREQLTRLECEVLLGVASGLRSADIARNMRRSCKTVEKHRANVQRKLGLRHVAQLTAYAIQAGLLKPSTILGPSSPARTRPAGR